MKKLFFSILVALVSATGFAQNCCADSSCAKDACPFGEFVKAFCDSTSYAMVDLGCPVLLVSSEIFDNDGSPAAIAATVYGLDKAGKIVCYGEVRSQGTLYPLAIKDNKIITAGHHFVSKYAVKGSPLSLQLVEEASATYNTKGKASYQYENHETEEYLTPKDSKRLDKMFDEFDEAKTVVFTPVNQ